MIKFDKKYLKQDIYLVIGIFVYLIFTLGWYYKLPWLVDHTIYLHIAKALNVEDLNWWNNYRSSLPVGHHNERWALLSLIIIFDKIFFFLTPGSASQILLISIYLGILILIYKILNIYNNKATANFFLIFWLFSSHNTKNRATEFLAEPFAIFFICLAIFSFILLKKNKNYFFLFLASFSLISVSLTKIHLSIMSLLIVIIYFEIIKRNFAKFILYGFSTIIFYNLVLLFNYGLDLYVILIKNSLMSYKAYIGGGLASGKGLIDGGWAMVWFKIIMGPDTLMPIFFLSALFIFSKKYNNKYIFSWLFVVFLITIFVLTAFSNFPANYSYAYPLYIFSIPCLAIFAEEFFDYTKNHFFQYILIILSSIVPLIIVIYFFRVGLKENDLSNSFYVLTVILTLIFVTYFYLKKSAISFYVLLFFLSINIFWNNWQPFRDHSKWKTLYNEHYIFLRGAAKLIDNFDNENIAIHFSTWPIHKQRSERDKNVIEPGIRSLIRNDIEITGYIGAEEVSSVIKFKYLVHDKFLEKLKLIDELAINTSPYGYSTKLYLYELINEN